MFDLEHEQQADYRVVHLRGDGAAIGQAMARSLQRIPSLFRKLPWEDDRAFLGDCARVIREVAPWLWDELATFADCIGMAPEQGLFVRAGSLPHGCSAVAWRAHDDQILAGRTYDFYVRIRTRHLLITEPEYGYAHLGMNGGLVGGRYDGVNQHGLFVSLHKVMADRPVSHDPGVPYHLVPRLALQSCRTAAEAADLLSRLPHLASFNYLLADASGDFVALECYPGRKPERRESDEVLAVTNHYTSPSLSPLQGARPRHDSQRRQSALESIQDRRGDGWTSTLDALANHESGVCAHREFGATLWAGVFDLGAKRAAYSFGAPCRQPMNMYNVPARTEDDPRRHTKGRDAEAPFSVSSRSFADSRN